MLRERERDSCCSYLWIYGTADGYLLNFRINEHPEDNEWQLVKKEYGSEWAVLNIEGFALQG